MLIQTMKRMRKAIVHSLAAVLALGLVLITDAEAMRVSPMVSEITTRGAGSSARIEVQNVGSTSLAFETRITRIEFDENGQMIETPSDDEFLVFPPQGVIPVNGRQVVRVQWVGDPELAVSRAYYVGIHQLPVDVEGTASDAAVGAQVQLVYHMKSLLTVAPPGAEPDVRVLSAVPAMVTTAAGPLELTSATSEAAAAPAAAAGEVPGVEVELRNTGTRYALMSGADWTFEGKDPQGQDVRVRLTANQINEAVGVGYLAPAGGRRVFRVPTGQAFAEGQPIKLSFSQ
ncbi:hypothetical protein [Brevundimonas sp.]|uniref:hypothetical protein n=1 Tax=Brevundimonas sp. TaxID=1871086 RepID=UPI0035B1BE74